MKRQQIVAARLAGRCADGFERGRGQKWHAIPQAAEFGTALCGATPGRLSAGWYENPAEAITCARCLRRLA